jgi:hypothetical protein
VGTIKSPTWFPIGISSGFPLPRCLPVPDLGVNLVGFGSADATDESPAAAERRAAALPPTAARAAPLARVAGTDLNIQTIALAPFPAVDDKRRLRVTGWGYRVAEAADSTFLTTPRGTSHTPPAGGGGGGGEGAGG